MTRREGGGGGGGKKRENGKWNGGETMALTALAVICEVLWSNHSTSSLVVGICIGDSRGQFSVSVSLSSWIEMKLLALFSR